MSWNPAALLATLSLAAALLLPRAATADPLPLYEGHAITTGTGEQNRQLGLAQSLEDVLVKVSGDPTLIGDAAVSQLEKTAAGLVDSFTYRDMYSGRPLHDEQGSYDRPHDLNVSYNPAKIDAALRALGREPWTEARPLLAVFLSVRRGDRAFVVTADGERDADMRSSLGTAADRLGFPHLVPGAQALAAAGLTADSLPDAGLGVIDTTAKTFEAAAALAGNLLWSDTAHGWVADWRIRSGNATVTWQVRGVGFDEAFRNGLRGAAQVLSGHGEPANVTF